MDRAQLELINLTWLGSYTGGNFKLKFRVVAYDRDGGTTSFKVGTGAASAAVPVTNEKTRIVRFASRSPPEPFACCTVSTNAAGNGDKGGRYDDVGDSDAGDGVRL